MADRRYVVLGFAFADGRIQFGVSAHPVLYLVRVQCGEYLARFGAGAKLRWAIPQANHQHAMRLRNKLNELEADQAAVLAADQSVPEGSISAIWGTASDARSAYEANGEIDPEVEESVWRLLPRIGIAPLPIDQPLNLDDPFVSLPSTRSFSTPSGSRRALDRLVGRLFIFDLDGTLIDSSDLGDVRSEAIRTRNWQPVKECLDQIKPFPAWSDLAPHQLPRVLFEAGYKVALVSRTPRWYVDAAIERFEIKAGLVLASCGENKARAFERCLDWAGADPGTTFVFGDDGSDFRAADLLGCWHLGNPWASQTMSPHVAADISWLTPYQLLDEPDWTELLYLGERDEPAAASWHRGSLLPVAPDVLALGRYFKAGRVRHSEPLSKAVLSAKGTAEIEPSIGEAFEVALRPLAQRFGVDLVVSVPPHKGKDDRFSGYRTLACSVLRAHNGTDLRVENQVPPNYRGLAREKKRALRAGRYRCYENLDGATAVAIDDVLTTGSTLGAVADALIEAGAERVIQLGWAVTQD